MLNINIPGFKNLELQHAVFDYNGTLAVEGNLIQGVQEKLNILAERIHVHVITGDSYGHARNELLKVNCKLSILSSENQVGAKRDYIKELDPNKVVAIGNGRNDQYMLKDAALGIVVMGSEGVAIEAITAADLLMPDIFSVFDTLLQARRLSATMRA